MSTKPSYRSMYASFWDDADQQSLSHLAYRVLTTLKGKLPATGLGVIYDDFLARWCNCTEDELQTALEELERPKRDGSLGWIVRDRRRHIVWVVNGLKFEPQIRSSDSKHKTFVAECLAQISGGADELPIIRQFRAHYAKWFGAPPPSTPRPLKDPAADPDEDPSQDPSEALTKPRPNTNQSKPATRARARSAAAGDVTPLTGTAPVTPIDRAPSMAYLTRCVMALNLGMQSNPEVAGAREIPPTSQSGQVDWERDGIDVEIAVEVISRRCAMFRPTPRARQIHGLKYFDDAVRERHAELAAGGHTDRSRWVKGAKNAADNEWLTKNGY